VRILGRTLHTGEDAFDERGIREARDHLELPAAAAAALDLDRKHPFQPLIAREMHARRRHERGQASGVNTFCPLRGPIATRYVIE